MWGRTKKGQPYPKKRKTNIGNIHGKKGMFQDPQYVSLLRRQNLHELDLAGASRAGGKATLMTSRQLNITPRQVRGQLSRSRRNYERMNKDGWVGKDAPIHTGDALELNESETKWAMEELKKMAVDKENGQREWGRVRRASEYEAPKEEN